MTIRYPVTVDRQGDQLLAEFPALTRIISRWQMRFLLNFFFIRVKSRPTVTPAMKPYNALHSLGNN
jgi:hypothetical protein